MLCLIMCLDFDSPKAWPDTVVAKEGIRFSTAENLVRYFSKSSWRLEQEAIFFWELTIFLGS